MALECPSCGSAVSDRIEACGSCGAAIATGRSGVIGFLLKHWRGEYSLARSYWLNGLLVSLAIGALNGFASELVARASAQSASLTVIVLCLLTALAWVWSVRGTWVSATKHRRAGGSWAGLAKTMLVLAGVRSALDVYHLSGFLLEHGETALGHQAGPEYQITLSPDGSKVYVIGGMNDGVAASLERTLQRAPQVKTVVLDSIGGWVQEGERLADVISSHHLATLAEHECSSSCTIAYLAGHTRALMPGARLGFHRVRTLGGLREMRKQEVRDTRAAYERRGLPEDFVAKIVDTPNETIWYPTILELLKARAVHASSEWEAARDDLRGAIGEWLEADYGEFELSPQIEQGLIECAVEERIKFLNLTGCAYFFDRNTTSEEAHLREQTACIERANGDAHAARSRLECAKQHIPNDWSVFEPMYVNVFRTLLPDRAPARAERRARCVAHALIAQVRRSTCEPLNIAATTPDTLFTGFDCVRRDAQLQDATRRIVARCKKLR